MKRGENSGYEGRKGKIKGEKEYGAKEKRNDAGGEKKWKTETKHDADKIKKGEFLSVLVYFFDWLVSSSILKEGSGHISVVKL